MKVKFTKVVAALLSLSMLVGMMPAMSAKAATAKFTNSKLDVVTNKESTLATGVTLDNYTVYDKNGDQVKMFVTTADMNVDTVELFASYKNMDPTNYGMSKLTEQVAAFNEKAAAGDDYYKGTVVAGINASYYNMINGKPTGTFVMKGIDVTDEAEGNASGYFAVMKDGSVKMGSYNDYSDDKGNIQEAIGIYHMLVENGEIVKYQRDGKTPLDDAKKYPRQTIGITADNKVIIMMADGNQAPKSIGLTLIEQAQVMLDLGCVWAGHLDGGGSGTYACKPEGQDKFVITNNPSDGSERSISNGLIVVSTEASSKEFSKVKYDVSCSNVTPGTSVPVSLAGVSSSGNAADIPAEVTYETTNGTFDGEVFTAGSELGEATITAMYNGKEAGKTTINIVLPDKIRFASSETTVPFGKTVSLEVTGTLGVKEVAVKAEDFTFSFTDAKIGTLNGFDFVAGNGEVTEAKLTAALTADKSVTAVTNITLGKGSEVVYDFEDGTDQKVVFNETPGTKYNYVWPETEQKVVDASTGKVQSGNYALAGHVNYGNSLESGYMKTSLYSTEQRIFENAKRIGIWVYIPDEFVGLWARWVLQPVTFDAEGNPGFAKGINASTMDTTAGGTGYAFTFDEPGWHYLHIDTSAYSAVGWRANTAMIEFYISDRDGSAYNYKAAEQSNIPGQFQLYFDDLTVDYSTAVDDREAPVISNVTYAVEGMADAAALSGQTIETGKVSVAAAIDDYKGKSNYTGLDTSSVEVHVDGVKVNSSYSSGKVSAELKGLTNGKHTIKFSAKDKMGNYDSVIEYINVNVKDNLSTVKLVPADESLDRIKLGSIYNMNLVATAMEEVDKVEVVIDLDNNSKWQLANMEMAEGFEAEYSVEKTDNIATITITRTGENDTTGEGVLATLPVRTWELKTGYKYPNGTQTGVEAFTYEQWKAKKEFWRMSVIANVDKGILTRVDDSVSTFTGERVFCDTEMWGNFAAMNATPAGKEYYATWDGGHLHSAKAIEDKAPTCTKAGYTGRTFCDVCNSPVEWGTTEKATGHKYDVVDGIAQCVNGCEKKFTGTLNGKEYVDGVLAADGWKGDFYYKDGAKLTGIQKVAAPESEDEFYYNFGDDGVCKGKYTGLVEENGNTYYAKLGVIEPGWFQVEEEWYYFVPETKVAAEGTVTTEDGITFEFEDGKPLSGVWEDYFVYKRYWYGPAYYKQTSKNVPYLIVEIDGDTYLFNTAGIMATGMRTTHESNEFTTICYDCGTDGKATLYNGVYENMYFENGIQQSGRRLVEDGGKHYFIKNNNLLAATCTVELTDTLTGLVFADDKLYYAKNGEIVNGAVKVGEDIYYFSATKYYAMADGKYYISADYLNGLLPAGTYEVKDSKIVIQKEKEGLVEENGNLYYYENGKKIKGAVKVGNDIYYFSAKYNALADGKYYISADLLNGLLPAGSYEIKDYKIVIPEVKNGLVEEGGKLYYYENGKKVKGAVKVGTDIYYFSAKSYALADGKYYISADLLNGLLPAGTYEIKDYKIVIPEVKEGLVEEDGKLYYYENGKKVKGAVKVEEDIYYFSAKAYALADGKYYIAADLLNGLLPAGTYEIKDYKIVIPEVKEGIVEENGNLYYYENGKKVRGAVKIGEDIYYFGTRYNALADGKYFIAEEFLNGLLPEGSYVIKDYKIVL